TTLDRNTPYSNESWYSPEATGIVSSDIPPSFTNIYPVSNTVNIPTNSVITFLARDNNSVVSQSIRVIINGSTVLDNGLFNAGYSGSIIRTNGGFFSGYRVNVNPDAPFAEWTWMNVYMRVSDNSGLTNNKTVKFRTEDAADPSMVILSSPRDTCTTNVTQINFVWQKSTDTGSGVTNYHFKASNTISSRCTNIFLNVTTNVVLNDLQDGNILWCVHARDRSGRSGPLSSIFSVNVSTTNPFIVATVPLAGQTNVPFSSGIRIYFNKSMNVSSTNCVTFATLSNNSVPGSRTLISNSYPDDTVVFTPDYYLSFNTFYTVKVSTQAWDAGGNPLLKGTNFFFKTEKETNKVSVLSNFPADGSSDVNIWQRIGFRFDRSMNTSSTLSFHIRPAVNGRFSWYSVRFADDTLVFRPSSPFGFVTYYTCTMDTNASSIWGKHLKKETNIIFRTEQDHYPPGNPVRLTSAPENKTIRLEWENPSDPDFNGTVIYFRTDGRYPSVTGDGTLLCDRTASPGSSDSFLHQDVLMGMTYYYTAFTYDAIPNFSVPDDNARTKAMLGTEVDYFDIRPNRFDPGKNGYIEFCVSLPETTDVNITIFNMAGELIDAIKLGAQKECSYRWYGELGKTSEKKLVPGAYVALLKTGKGLKKMKVFYAVK
ncbi:MAG: Ig-like domain-containing protein, partial [bacterium]|nr:Ig-like domain-containing protein [bacterium]